MLCKFAIDEIYDQAYCKLSYFMFILPWKVFMMEPILDYTIHVHFAMDGIYDAAHSRLCYLCKFCHGRNF